MIVMMTRKLWMTHAARLGCAVVVAMLSACTADMVDNPVTQPDEKSAVDSGTWHVKDEYMDKSVQPGDDFFMYSNGGYWKSTEISGNALIQMLYLSQIGESLKQKTSALTLPSEVKVTADQQKTDAATMTAQHSSLQQAVQRVEALKTKQEAWQLMADLCTEGYNCPLGLMSFAKNGKIAFIFYPTHEPEYKSAQLWAGKPLSWHLANNADLLAKVQSVGGGHRRGFAPGQWPMLVTMCNTLGIPLDDAYTVDAEPLYIENNTVDFHLSKMSEVQDMSVDEWKSILKSAVMDDAVYFDNDSAAAKNLTCQEAISNFLGSTLNYEQSYHFAKAYVTDAMKQQAREGTEMLRSTFRERIRQNTWMSAASKQNAIAKLDAMVFNVGSPDEWIDEALPDLSQEPNLAADIRALRRSLLALKRKITGMTIARGSFHQILIDTPLTTFNAFYYQSGNYMNILPAFIMPPAYDSQQNDAHNFATMTVWGHEITHGFDTEGAKYNTVGDLGTLWASEADSQEFQSRTGQLATLYSSYDVMPLEAGVKADGEYTLAENVADLGGFIIAYDAYANYLDSHGFKGDGRRLQLQRFYQAVAYMFCAKWTAEYARLRTVGNDPADSKPSPYRKDNHSLFRERVNGVVVNSDDWYDLFDVKPGNKIYLAPENRVRIW
jgi:predicted metalloendopeptidase